MDMDIIEDKQAQLKNILENAVVGSGGRRTESAAREIAVTHAKILQNRKDLEREILDSLILLSEYPLQRGPANSASNPAPSDVAGFKTHVRLFQPSDYDDLIVERNVNDLCGYTLCPKQRRKLGAGGEWKLTASGNIVKRKDLEQWCSAACTKRALFVRVQLNETAAWERIGDPDIHIDLLEEDRSLESEAERMARSAHDSKLDEQRQAAQDADMLALERGDVGVGGYNILKNNNASRVNVVVRERDIQAARPPEDMSAPSDDHLLIEGYKFDLPMRPKEGS